MKTCKKFTPDEVETIKNLYKDHLLSEMAEILGRSPGVICHKIQFLGLKDRPHEKEIIRARKWKECEVKFEMPIKDLLNSLYWDSDLSLLEIADMLNVCNTTIDNWMKALKIPRRSDSEGTKCRFNKMSSEQMNKHMLGARIGHKKCCSLINTDDRGFIRDDEWLNISKTVKIRDGFKCTECGMTEDENRTKYGTGLSVHHVIHYHICKNHDINNLIVLCSGCHLKLHRRSWWDEVRKQKKYLQSESVDQNQSIIFQF